MASKKQSVFTARTYQSKANTERALQRIKHKDNPVAGITLFVVYCLVKTVSYVVCQMLYNRNPDLQPFQMLFMRSVIGVVIMVFMVNVKLKKLTWDEV